MKTLAQAIREVTGNSDMRDKAEALGARLRAEDGIGNAIAIIETLSD